MKYDCIRGYEWPGENHDGSGILNIFRDQLNIEAYSRLITKYNKSDDIIITFLSKEYLELGKLWLSALKRIGLNQYIIIAVDKETGLFLDSLKVPNYKIIVNGHSVAGEKFISRTGFTAKGLEITALKYPFVKLSLDLGFNVLLMDIDALLLRTIPPEYFSNTDIAFQRVVYFPERIAKEWGFAACSGFVWFRRNNKTIDFICRIMELQYQTYDDQIVLNLGLWEEDITWLCKEHIFPARNDDDLTQRLKFFKQNDDKVFDGHAQNSKLTIRALPPTLFWRNNVIPFRSSEVILFHPNSPKDELEKLRVFREYNIC